MNDHILKCTGCLARNDRIKELLSRVKELEAANKGLERLRRLDWKEIGDYNKLKKELKSLRAAAKKVIEKSVVHKDGKFLFSIDQASIKQLLKKSREER